MRIFSLPPELGFDWSIVGLSVGNVDKGVKDDIEDVGDKSVEPGDRVIQQLHNNPPLHKSMGFAPWKMHEMPIPHIYILPL